MSGLRFTNGPSAHDCRQCDRRRWASHGTLILLNSEYSLCELEVSQRLDRGELAHPRTRSPHETRRIRRTRHASMRHNGLRASIPAAVTTIAISPGRHGAADGERPGPPVPWSARLRGTRGRGMATPNGPCPARHLGRERRCGGAAERRGEARSARAPSGPRRVGTRESGILRTCEGAARGRFSAFQDFRFSRFSTGNAPLTTLYECS